MLKLSFQILYFCYLYDEYYVACTESLEVLYVMLRLGATLSREKFEMEALPLVDVGSLKTI